MGKIIRKRQYPDFVPNNWIDLFEFISYSDTENKILEYVKQIKDGMK